MKKRCLCLLTVLLLVLSMAACSSEEPAEKPDDEAMATETGKILVAYFSATGNTRAVAEQIADTKGATLFEIVPEQPYTEDDLNWRKDGSRTTEEQNDDSARPAISSKVENIDEYDTVFLGYPIWFGQAPKIISTFLESYDFSGKTIIPFCTSGGSGIGSSATELHGLVADDAVWQPGTRFPTDPSKNEIEEWVNSLVL